MKIKVFNILLALVLVVGFSLVPAVPASAIGPHLQIVTQPTNTYAGEPILGAGGVPLQVRAQGAEGVVPGVPVTVDAFGGFSFDSGTTVQTTDEFGIATFDDLVTNTPGIGYQLYFNAAVYGDIFSSFFDVILPEVWVSDNWNDQADVNTFNPALTWQYDAFATIQEGVNAVSGSTVYVLAGTYDELLTINVDGLTLLGAQAGVDPRPTMSAGRSGAEESIIRKTYTTETDALNPILIAANNVTINGFTISPHYEVEVGDPNGLNKDLVRQDDPGPWVGTTISYNILTATGHNIVDNCDELVQLKGVTGAVIEYNYGYHETAEESGGNAFNIADDSADSVIRFNEAYRCGDFQYAGKWGGAIYTYESDNISVIGNKVVEGGGITFGASKATSDAAWPPMRNIGGTVEGNIVENATFGLEIFADDVTVSGNDATGCGEYALNIIGSNVTVQGNNLCNSGTGILVEDKGEFSTSGVSINYNTFTNNNIQLTDDTGTLDIESILNLNNNTFDRAVTVDHDGASLLPFIWSNIQHAVDTASPDDTVNVAAGTYDEQVEINQSLTLQGAGDSTIIQPSSEAKLTSLYTLGAQVGAYWNGNKLASIINVSGVGTAGVTIKDLQVDGVNINSKPAGANYIVGISYGETGGTIDNATVVNMNTIPVTAGDRTYGIWLDAVATPVSVEVKGCDINLYNKNGINSRGAALTVNIHDNIVAGPGDSPCVPNGILLINGAAGTVSTNAITNHHYLPEEWTACGIATWDVAGVTIEGNTISNCDSGIGLSGASGVSGTTATIIRGNTITGVTRGVYLECPDTTNNTIVSNNIQANEYGIYLGGPESPTYDPGEEVGPGNKANFNNITLNTEYGVVNYNPGVTFDATKNWWGNANGPQADLNQIPDGENVSTGDKVSDYVHYAPWLAEPWTNQVWVNLAYNEDTPGWGADRFYSIQTAINTVPPGTTINVAEGVYLEFVYIMNKSLTLQGAGAETTFIVFPDGELPPPPPPDGMPLGIVNVLLDDGSTVVFDGFTVLEYEFLIFLGVVNGSSVTISNNILQFCGCAVFCPLDTLANGSSVTIEDNEIYNSLDGIYFKLITEGSELTIQNNKIHDNADDGIYLDEISGGSAVTIQGNKIHNNEGGGISFDGIGGGSAVAIQNNNIDGNVDGIYIESTAESTVAITGNTITNNVSQTSGIDLGGGVDATSVMVSFNNIVDNEGDGVYNGDEGFLNAKNNWWGSPDGPGEDEANGVAGNVDYEPWLTVPVIGGKSGTVGAGGTLDATGETGASVGVTGGSATVTTAKYSGDPGTGGFGGTTGQYIDIQLADFTPGTEIEIRLYYTNADIVGLTEATLTLRWWDGDSWELCSGPLSGDTGVRTADILLPPPDGAPYSGFMWAKIRSALDPNPTAPTLEQLIGTPLGGGGAAAAAPGGGGGGGGGGGLTLPTLKGLVSTPTIKLDPEGAISLGCVVQTDDGRLTLDIAKGTRLLDSLRRPLSSLSAELDPSPPAPPSGAAIILAYDFGPEGAVFMPTITMTFEYDPTTFTEDIAEQSLYIARWDGSTWVALTTTVDTMTRTASCEVSHFTTFALIGAVTAPAPSAFSVSGLSIYPLKVQPEEAVAITISVANTGGTEGSYSVALKINGVMEAEESVTVAPGGSQSVGFSVTMEEAGSYSVDVNGLSGSFTVAAAEVPPEVPFQIAWWIWVIAGVVVVGLIIFFIVRRMAY